MPPGNVEIGKMELRRTQNCGLVLLFEMHLISCKNELNGFHIELPNDVAISKGKNPVNLSVLLE